MAEHYNTIVQQIREKIDIVAVIGRHVPLKRSGASFKGCCPFHQEKTPSFFVHPDKQFYYCFGCQAKGDVFAFLMDYEGKRFPEVIKDLADELAIALPETPFASEADHEEDQKREKLYQINHWARIFFIDQLQTPEANGVREYIRSRGMSEQMVNAFGIGYAPDDWGQLTEYYRAKEVDLSLCCEVGLLKQADKSERIYDRFRHRLIFPIILSSGRVAGFGGRALRDDESAKYLNSPESIIFKKSLLLYGIEQAAQPIRRKELAILVEGYLDVISMHQYGFTHTIAALGTALTQDHLYQLKRHTKRVLLLFDGDKAGRKAAERALQILLPGGLSVDILVLPKEHDPDTYLQEFGREKMAELIEKKSESAFDFWRGDFKRTAEDEPVKLRDAAQRVLELLQKLEDPILRDLYLKRTSERLGVEESQLRRGLLRVVPRPSATYREKSLQAQEEKPTKKASFDPIHQSEQQTLASMIKIVLENPDLFSFAEQAELALKLHEPLLREAWSQLIADLQEGGEEPSIIKNVLESLTPLPVFQNALAQSLMKDRPFEKETIRSIWFDLAHKLEHLQIERKLKELSHKVSQAAKAGDQAQLEKWVYEKQILQKQRLEWKSKYSRPAMIEETNELTTKWNLEIKKLPQQQNTVSLPGNAIWQESER